MCDTLCATLGDRTLFAKNSDRPGTEVQLVEAHGARPPKGRLRTQYLDLADAGATALLGARPDWLWGFEHGVNDHRVAVGNEQLYTTADAAAAPVGLIGMDLVRLLLERATSADEALEQLDALLAAHGQGGVATPDGASYFSSFLVADPGGGWVVETSGAQWAARPVTGGAAISNRISLRTDWTRASAGMQAGTDIDDWRDPDSDTGHADDRLAVTTATATRPTHELDARTLVATLRDHGGEPWGAPGANGPPTPPPDAAVTVCMHLGGFRATTSSMVAELPADPELPLRAWVAPGSPCCTVFLPTFPPHAVPTALARPETWHRFAALRDQVEARPDALAGLRARLDPVEAELWDEADTLTPDPAAHQAFAEEAWRRIDEAVRAVEAGVGRAAGRGGRRQSGGGPR